MVLRMPCHSERRKVQVEHSLLFVPFGVIKPSEPDHLTHHFGIETVAFRLGINLADVRRKRTLLILEPFDTLDQRFQLTSRKAVFRHARPFSEFINYSGATLRRKAD